MEIRCKKSFLKRHLKQYRKRTVSMHLDVMKSIRIGRHSTKGYVMSLGTIYGNNGYFKLEQRLDYLNKTYYKIRTLGLKENDEIKLLNDIKRYIPALTIQQINRIKKREWTAQKKQDKRLKKEGWLR